MIIHNNLTKVKNKILPTCSQGNFRDDLGEFSNTSYGVFRAERVKVYRDSLGEFSNTSYGVFRAERVKVYRDSLGEFSNTSYGVFRAERVKAR